MTRRETVEQDARKDIVDEGLVLVDGVSVVGRVLGGDMEGSLILRSGSSKRREGETHAVDDGIRVLNDTVWLN